MENADLEEPPSDGLEITSIGSLYAGGPWDKKYWSCSRGKDRYPYPIGYHAVRTYAGNTYQMEIREGQKGPLFVITSMGGESCFGQTPYIAWENFQKKSGPRVKTWHAKRFSCKIDGVELFGFRNPFVLRLLRQLVANANGTAESSNLCNGAPRLDDEKQSPKSCTYPNLLPFLEKPKSTGKRSQKKKHNSQNSTCELGVKKFPTQGLFSDKKVHIATDTINGNGGSYEEGQDADHCYKNNSSTLLDMTPRCVVPHNNPVLSQKESSIPVKDNKFCPTCLEHCRDGKFTSMASFTSDRDCIMHEYRGTFSAPVDHPNVVERGNDQFKLRDDLHLDFSDFDNVNKEASIHQEQQNPAAFKKPRLAFVGSKHSNVSWKPIDRPSVDLHHLRAVKENDELLISSELESAKESEYHVVETLDPLEDKITDCTSRSRKESPHSGKDKLVVVEQILRNSTSQSFTVVANYMPTELDTENAKCSVKHMDAPPIVSQEISCHVPLSEEQVLSQGLLMGLHPDEVITSSNSNISSEKSDSDSNGQELLKSMMRVLLPQALPLLKKTSKTISSTSRNAKTFFTKSDNQLDLMGMTSQEENGRSHSVINIACQGSLENVKSVVPDSLEDDQTGCDCTYQRRLHFNSDQAGHALSDKEVCNADVLGLSADANEVKGFSNCLCANGGCNEIIHEVDLLPKSENLKSNSPIYCTPPNKQIPSQKESPNDGMNEVENALHIEVQNVDVVESLHVNPCFTASSDLLPLLSNAEYLEEACPSSSKYLELNSNVLVTDAHGSSVTNNEKILDQHHVTNYDTDKLPLVTDTKDSKSDTVDTIHIPQMEFDGVTAIVTCDASTDVVSSTGYCNLSTVPLKRYNGPLSESIICRNIKDNGDSQRLSAMGVTETNQAIAAEEHKGCKILLANELNLDMEHHCLSMPKGSLEPEGMFNMAPAPCQNHAMAFQVAEDICSHRAYVQPVPYVKRHQVDAVVDELLASHTTKEGNNAAPCFHKQGMLLSVISGGSISEAEIDSDSKFQHQNLVPDNSFPKVSKSTDELEGFLEIVGCYVHPMPVLSILLRRKGDDIHICVLCGCLEDNDTTLFIYKLSIMEVEKHCPSFLGYASIVLPLSKATYDRNIAFERSGIQFAPDDECLVLLNSIRTPCCREQTINCLCSVCTSVCYEENAVKVVRVQLGYVSIVLKLTTTENVHCILVCEPSYLIAVGDSGRLHVWIMNLMWSAEVDYFMLPSFDDTCPLLELKRMPTCASLVVGHNGIGCFGLWDISKRILVARFFGSTPIFQALPVAVFNWQTTKSKVDEHVKEMIAMIEMGFTKAGVHNSYLPTNGGDVAICLIVSAPLDFDAQHGTSMKHHETPIGWWRLALLVKNTVIVGSILDSRASALDVVGGCSIIGTCNGLAYIWELSTGRKLADLHHFIGGVVSCVATEADTGTLAVADNEGRLLVYVQHPKNHTVNEPN